MVWYVGGLYLFRLQPKDARRLMLWIRSDGEPPMIHCDIGNPQMRSQESKVKNVSRVGEEDQIVHHRQFVAPRSATMGVTTDTGSGLKIEKVAPAAEPF